MGQIIDLTGKSFGRWLVLGLSSRRTPDGRGIYWDCECQCPARTRRSVYGGDLKRIGRRIGSSSSCGCYMRERAAERSAIHSLSRHPGYRAWIQMRSRCLNPTNTMFYLYGGRGITVCRRWKYSFEKFWEDMGAAWSVGLSLDRINTNMGYSPTNCRWATRKEQANNRRTNRLIRTPSGRMTITAAAHKYGIKRETIYSRLRAGWSEHEVLVSVKR